MVPTGRPIIEEELEEEERIVESGANVLRTMNLESNGCIEATDAGGDLSCDEVI